MDPHNPLAWQTQVSAKTFPALTDAAFNSPLHASANQQPHINPSTESPPNTPKDADETLSNPLFPPLPSHYTLLTIQFYRLLSLFLSVAFLIFIVTCAMFKTVPSVMWVLWSWFRFKDPDRFRPFYEQEKTRKHIETGKLKCDIRYYTQRVGLECEESNVETEDGFILTIQHIIDRRPGSVDFKRTASVIRLITDKYPVLLLPGLMQSSGAYCVNDESSLAFFLCWSGYDVWLGNNRGYFNPKHKYLKPSNPQFWAWNLRQMGCLDIPALVSNVCAQTGRKKIALIAHSQATSLTFLALSKDQVPQLGESLSCFIALAPAVFAGTLLRTFQFSFVRIMSTRLYRAIFGIHSFIPLMMVIHTALPGRLYGWLGYRVFNYLFSWTDLRWERRLRNRFFQFAPVYVSSECMRWWLGRDCFAKQKCILPETETKWYDPTLMPPVSLYVGGKDKLVDGRKLIERFEKVETDVIVLRGQVDEEYEHLDCIWSFDCIERVGKKIRDDIWSTVNADNVIVPNGCRDEDKGFNAKDIQGIATA